MDAQSLSAASPLAWIHLNQFVTENQKPLEFVKHRFLIDLYADMHHDIAVKKSAQVGESVERIFKSLWCAKYLGANIIYVLPTKNVVDEFVVPKVNPIITSNPGLRDIVSTDSKSLKQVGDRFIYYSGAFSESAAIMKSADILVLDELDRMKNPSIVTMFDSRLQASDLGWRWRLSNPSQAGFGIDQYYTDSDQRHWFITCSHCGHRWYIDYEKKDNNHYVDKERQVYACGKCDKDITNKDRQNGEWVVKFPSRDRHGYWISQMMAPWVSAKRVLQQKEEMPIDVFYNFVLGKAYTPSDMIVNRETILRANAPSLIAKKDVVIGVDQNVSEQIWVAGTSEGIFAHGKTKSWEEFERLKLMYDALVVADPAPYPVMPRQLASKYKDFYMCRFKQFDGMKTVEWDEVKRVVYVDRTRGMDTVANEITQAKLLFRENPYALEDYIADWQNIYRTTVEKPNGKSVSEWLKKDNKESDFSLATLYFRVGLARMLGKSSGVDFAEPIANQSQKADYVGDGKLLTDMHVKIEEALTNTDSGDWRTM